MAFLSLKNVTVKLFESIILNNISLSISVGEQLAIVGNSGSGKTILAQTIAGQHYYSGEIQVNLDYIDGIKSPVILVDQQHRFKNLSGMSNQFYYQQRFNSFDASDAKTVSDELEAKGYNPTLQKSLIDLLNLQQLLEEPLIQLSNGENKRLQLAKALLHKPGLLILDNPFIGLDADGRKVLHTIINTLINSGQQLILITTPEDIPAGITHIAVLENGKLKTTSAKNEFKEDAKTTKHNFNSEVLKTVTTHQSYDFSVAIQMINASVTYNNKVILKDVNWLVKRGERWNVSGNNGAGKSTLLSLITADNPQAYANEMYLFDKRRGSGESIWDIKKLIGFVSPEMHLYFECAATVFETIASGLFDTIGLLRKINETHEHSVEQWLNMLSLQTVKHKNLNRLSLGEQRLVLLARALIKNPPLLILDEPCQGLDDHQVEQFKHIINKICLHFNTTLVYVSHYKNHLPSCITHELRLHKGLQF